MVQYRRGRKTPWMVQIRNAQGDLVTSSFAKKEDAEDFEALEKRKRKLTKAGMEAPLDEILFVDNAKKWLENREDGKQSSFKQDESRLRNYWVEHLGHYAMQHITSTMILARLDEIQFKMKHSPADRNRHRALLHKLFNDAKAQHKVLINPVSAVPLVDESKKTKSSGTVKSTQDQEIYLAGLYKEAPQYGMLGDLMLWTGGRIMAAAAAQYRDVDFEMGTVRVCRLYERASASIQDRTKGGGDNGEEVMPLFPRLRAQILWMRGISLFTRPTDFIACGPKGDPIPYETFLGAHNRVLLKTKLTPFTPHALRKAFATNMKRAGYTRSEIREMLGHSSDAMTEKYDLKDIEHLVEKGKRLGFAFPVSPVSAEELKQHRISRRIND